MSVIVAKPFGSSIPKAVLSSAFRSNGCRGGFAVATQDTDGKVVIIFRGRYASFQKMYQSYLNHSKIQKEPTLFYFHGPEEIFESVEDDQPVCVLEDTAMAVSGKVSEEPYVEELESYLGLKGGIDDLMAVVNDTGHSVAAILEPCGLFTLPKTGEFVGNVWFSEINFPMSEGQKQQIIEEATVNACTSCGTTAFRSDVEKEELCCFSCWSMNWVDDMPSSYAPVADKTIGTQTHIPFAPHRPYPYPEATIVRNPPPPVRKPCVPAALHFYGN